MFKPLKVVKKLHFKLYLYNFICYYKNVSNN